MLIADRAPAAAQADRRNAYYRRFEPTERVMHAVLMLTFIGCALTGVPLLSPTTPGRGRS